jgi:hypothetical protein
LKAEAHAAVLKQEVRPQGPPPPKGVKPDRPIVDIDDALDDALNAIAGPSRNTNDFEGEEDVELEDEEDDDYGEGKKKKKKPAAPKANGKGKKKAKEVKEKCVLSPLFLSRG